MYINNDMSQKQILNELQSRGISITQDRVRRILQDVGYTGEEYTTTVYRDGKREKGQTIKYPQIISKETFEAAKDKRAKANITVVRGSYYLGRHLIKCSKCGHTYIAYKVHKVYACLAFMPNNPDVEKCSNNATVNIIALDSVLWYDAKGEYINYLNSARNSDRTQYTERIKVLKQKIAQCSKIIDSASTKMEKVADIYVAGVYSKDKYNAEIAKIKTSTAQEEDNRIKYTNEIEKINQLISSLDDEDMTDKYINSLATVDSIENRKEMYDIVHRFITNVEVEFCECLRGYKSKTKVTKWRKITVTHLDGHKSIYYINQYSNDISYYTEPSELVGMMKDEAIEKGQYYIDITYQVQTVKHDVGRKKKK